MLLFGFLLLSTTISAQGNYQYYGELTDCWVKVFIEEGKVKSLESRRPNDTLKSGWSVVYTANASIWLGSANIITLPDNGGKKFNFIINYYGENYVILDLRGRNITGFKEGWYHMENCSFNLLSLSNNKIVEITSEVLNDLPPGLTTVDLMNNEIERLRNGIIDNKHLRMLNLQSNLIREIESGALNKSEQLEVLSLRNNQLNNTEFAATLPPNLRRLMLENNAITEISAFSFLGLGKLDYLGLRGNKITTIQKQSFQGLINVSFVSLSYNPIERVENDSFDSCPLLTSMVINGTRMNNFTNVQHLPMPKNVTFVVAAF